MDHSLEIKTKKCELSLKVVLWHGCSGVRGAVDIDSPPAPLLEFILVASPSHAYFYWASYSSTARLDFLPGYSFSSEETHLLMRARGDFRKIFTALPWPWSAGECLSRGNTRDAGDRLTQFKPMERRAWASLPSFRSLPARA